MTQSANATRFGTLHVKGNPILLFNAWDAGSAKAIAGAGAVAIATSSFAMAQAQGYADGEGMPFDAFVLAVQRIIATVSIPVSVDFEGGFAPDDDAALAANVARLLDAGAVGVNFEDRVVKGQGLYSTDRQAQRIRVLRRVADERGVPLFINARTDLFLRPSDSVASVATAIDRARAYAAAGASGLFIPGVLDEATIGGIADGSPLPVNVLTTTGSPSNARLAALGVARISYGKGPYVEAMATLAARAGAVLVAKG